MWLATGQPPQPAYTGQGRLRKAAKCSVFVTVPWALTVCSDGSWRCRVTHQGRTRGPSERGREAVRARTGGPVEVSLVAVGCWPSGRGAGQRLLSDGVNLANGGDGAATAGLYALAREARALGCKALGGRLLRRPGYTPRRSAHVLRADVAVSLAASGCVAVGSVGRVSVDLQRDRRPPARGGARGHVGSPAHGRGEGGAERPRYRRGSPRPRSSDGPLRGEPATSKPCGEPSMSCSTRSTGAASCAGSSLMSRRCSCYSRCCSPLSC